MEKTGKQRHLYFIRVSENCKLLTELYVVPDEINHQQSWFEDRHLQEIIILLRDPIKSKVVSYYEQYRRKKWSGIKEGNDSKKKPIPDEHQIKTGQSVKIGYKFVDSNMHRPSCLMPTKMGTPVWKDDNSRHAGGGFSPVRLFAKKLVVFVCKYHTATIGQTTSQLMKSLCATPPSKHIAISSYFAPKADADFVGPPVIQSAHRKRNKLKKIVKGMNTAAAAAGTKESIDVGGGLKGGGFFEKESENMDTETEAEIKPEVLPFSSVSDMDCDSDGMPDHPEELNERLDGNHRSPAECKDGLSLRHGEHSRRSLPLSPQEERSRKTTVTSSVKPEEVPIKVEENEHPQYSDVSKPFTCKTRKIEDASVDLPQKVDVLSSERTSSPSTYESRFKDSLNSINSEATLQSSSVGQESGVTRLTCASEVTESSPSSSGEFDHRIRRRENARSRNKLSLKRNEAKMGCASKVGSSKEKVLHEDVIKKSVEEALMGQKLHGSKKQKIHTGTVSEKDRVSVNRRSNNISESVRHPTGNCSVLLTDINLGHDKSLDESVRSTTSSLKRPMKNQQDISPSLENETTPGSSSDDELMSASFLHAENRPLNPAKPKEVKESRQQPPLQTTRYEDRKVNGVREVDIASSGCEQRDSFHSTTNKSVQNVEDNENTKKNENKKPSKLALFVRQNNRNKDSLHNIPKALHGEKKRKQKTNIGQLMEDLDWDSDSQGTKETQRTSEVIHSHKIEDKLRCSEEDEPMEVEDELSKLTPVEDVGCASDEVMTLPSDHYNPDDHQGASPPELKQDDPVHISDDSCGGDVMDAKQVEEEMENAPMGASREGKLGDLEDEVIDLSQEKDDDGESDSWFDNIFGNVRLVTELKMADIVYLTQRNKRYLHNIFQGKRACERHQCYKKKGPHRIGMAGNVRLGPFNEEQMDAVMGELVKTYCARHFKYMDYLSKVLLPEAMSKIYMDVHGVSHAHAEEVMKGLHKEHPRGT